jgi:hypothetical protein
MDRLHRESEHDALLDSGTIVQDALALLIQQLGDNPPRWQQK